MGMNLPVSRKSYSERCGGKSIDQFIDVEY